jgi:hypothetical protein
MRGAASCVSVGREEAMKIMGAYNEEGAITQPLWGTALQGLEQEDDGKKTIEDK